MSAGLSHAVATLPFLPLIGFLINGLFGARLPRNLVALIACALPAAAFGVTLWLFSALVQTTGAIDSVLSHWVVLDGLQIDIAFRFDRISAVMCLLITGIGTLIHLYSVAYMHDDPGFHRYFAYLNLFLFFMLVLVLGKNLPMLFAGWEGVGLASYLLIGFWFEDPAKTAAGMKAFVVNRVGDAAFVLAIFLIFHLFGTLDFAQINSTVGALPVGGSMLTLIALLLLLGGTGKSAQIPLHVWLPDAMAGPTPVSALIHAATMVTAGVYLLARLSPLFLQAPDAMTVIAWGGAITAFVGATMGMVQYNLKKVLAYSTMSQIGYMILACGLGAFEVGMFHLVTHAFFKACLFLGAGSVIHALHGEEDMRNMGGLAKRIPATAATFIIAGLALCGVPPLAGFFSKDEILWHAWAAPGGSPALWWLGSITALMTAFYVFRAIFMTFFGPSRVPAELEKKIHDAPMLMRLPLFILAFCSIGAGFLGLPGLWQEMLGVSAPFYDLLAPALNGGAKLVGDHHTEMILMGVSILLAIEGILLAGFFYLKRPGLSATFRARLGGLHTLLTRGYFFDTCYERGIVAGVDRLSAGPLARMIEAPLTKLVTVLCVGGALRATRLGSRLQNGNVQTYLLYLLAGLALALFWGVTHA